MDGLDADFEDISGLGAGDGDRAGEDVAAGTFLVGRELVVDVAGVLGMSAGATPRVSRRAGAPQVERVWMVTVSPEAMVRAGLAAPL